MSALAGMKACKVVSDLRPCSFISSEGWGVYRDQRISSFSVTTGHV